jgi:riboflavin synthase
MFTGIIQSVGTLASISPGNSDLTAQIEAPGLDPSAQITVGDSIAVNGICLTATRVTARGFWADVSRETLSRTTLGQLPAGAHLNLELALKPTSRLGGHLVSGHVDGVARLLERRQEGRSWRFAFEAPKSLARYIAEKGSICVDGISLTVNEVTPRRFCVNVVPHTLEVTTLGAAREGQQVNLEVDLVARYLERLLLGREDPGLSPGVTMDLLKDNGFSS